VGRFVTAAAVSYEQTARYFRNATVTGVPVRQAIFEVPPRPEGSAPRLLITAGSQGAKVFNDTLPQIAARLLDAVPELTILHQAGNRHQQATVAAYQASGADPTRWEVQPFIDDMPRQYALCDLVLARSGSTVAELAAAGRPSLLVPFPQAADDHQRRNAEVLVQVGAAVMLLQQELTPERLLAELTGLLRDPKRLRAMGEKARTLAHPEALEQIAAMVRELA
jgi:UDP-N-acetylglucosamine--N-acetylmuramyl-(pentapeptide) pyrophosphoryl-undecaprenol N-acetylglucosamine transferase